MTRQAQKAEAFRALHAAEPFVIPNPWDVGSAGILNLYEDESEVFKAPYAGRVAALFDGEHRHEPHPPAQPGRMGICRRVS
jgi:hypothetical protein